MGNCRQEFPLRAKLRTEIKIGICCFRENLCAHTRYGRGCPVVVAAAGILFSALAGSFTAGNVDGNDKPGAQGVAAPGVLSLCVG